MNHIEQILVILIFFMIIITSCLVYHYLKVFWALLREEIKKEVNEIVDFGIEIIECEYKDSCLKYSEFCFNEYKDVCSTRSVLTLSKNLRETELKKGSE